jgi:hypothetical protein
MAAQPLRRGLMQRSELEADLSSALALIVGHDQDDLGQVNLTGKLHFLVTSAIEGHMT